MKRIRFEFIAIGLFLLSGTTGCFADSRTKELKLHDIAYGKDSLHKMDVDLIANRTSETPLVILIHGGGWMAGDKKDAYFMRDGLLAAGINVININYRLASPGNTIHYKEMMADIDEALSFIKANAKKWNIRDSQFIFWGGSAGAHLALLYAYRYDKQDIISSVITLGAPTVLDTFFSMEGAKLQDVEGLLPLITGKPWSYDSTKLAREYKEASPYYSPIYKPTMLIHGEADDIVPLEQSLVMRQKLKEENIADTLIIIPGGGHGGEGASQEFYHRLNTAMFEWIIKYSKKQ
jgi:acetyl esterase/lipase